MAALRALAAALLLAGQTRADQRGYGGYGGYGAPVGLAGQGRYGVAAGYGGSGGYGGYGGHATGGDLLAAADGGGYGGGGHGGGYGSSCNCGPFELLGLLSGGAALAALGLFVVLQVQAGGGRQLPGGWQLPARLQLALRHALPAETLADRVVNVTCDVGRLLEAEQPASATSSGRSDDCQCFAGIVGSLAGFAALGGLVAYALQLAAAAGGGRSLGSSTAQVGSDKDELASEALFDFTLLKMATENDLTCVPYHLCEINSRSSQFGAAFSTAMHLASLPVSWFLSRTGRHELTFGTLCRGYQASHGNVCRTEFPHCVSRAAWRAR